LDSLHYFELSEEETLDIALKYDERIIEIALEDEYEESDYEKISHMMKSSSISFDHIQWEEFIMDNENEDVKGDQILPII